MRLALAGRDALVVMPTGGGKSLCYQAPAVVRGGLTVVVSPLIALMKDQVDGLTRVGVPAVRLDSSMTPDEKADATQLIRSGEARLVFTSPERLVNTGVAQFLRDSGANAVAIDEAHCISHWGHDFRPEYRQMARLKEWFPGAAVQAYTATATERVRADIVQQLGIDDASVLVGNFDRPNLTFRVLPRVSPIAQVREVLDRHPGDAGIVYCLRRADVDDMTAQLKAAKYKAVGYHAGMSPDQRRKAQESFASEETDIVVATVAFGMGIDRSNVRFVVHAAMPKSIEHYQQETGRAGRDGLPSECVLLFSGADFITLKNITLKSAQEAGATQEYVASTIKHLDDMAKYARGAVCRHRALVEYFGQQLETHNCGACDICLGDTDEVPEAKVVAQKILSCVARVKESFGVTHVLDILKGANTEGVRSRGHDKLTTYGLLEDVPKNDLRDWIYQLVGQGALAVSEGEYPLLKLTPASWSVMKGEQSVRLIRLAQQKRRSKRDRDDAPVTTRERQQPGTLPAGADPELFERLRQVRRQVAAGLGVQPYLVFPDSVLAEFARGRPSTAARMRQVSGVGDRKLADFGETFLDAIRAHCGQAGLALDVDAPVQRGLVPAKPERKPSARRDKVFELFRGEANVDAVAAKIDVNRATAVDYLTEFIRAEKPASIFPWVPEEVCERVAAAAEQCGTARLKPAFLALNEEVPYDTIRIVFAFLDSRDGR
ncbi:ATP-dependent DNA helicase RecQ [Urbifossiella limnaea]|uniref:DNA helicase RecQ n=2 Tax=Urbifossiella limnaea TaxID=2528023 RepID=A0A517XNM1_9BACT|nr:ATP-dependent DNA helicase RecQ [Urbifossiella limnaea]